MIFKNKLKICLSIFLFFFSLEFSYANVNRIEEIKINGNQRIDIETIISYANVSNGDIYNEELGNQILKDLFDTNLFSNIEVSFENKLLLITIKENPTINLVKFTGNRRSGKIELQHPIMGNICELTYQAM